MTDKLKTILVDLTPILPGGENGGAKIFVLTLLKHLAELAPKTQFVLLTHANSHNELLSICSKNMKCIMVLGDLFKTPKWVELALKSLLILSHLRKISYFSYHLNNYLNRREARLLLKSLNADLLFCPFTAPTYFEAGVSTVCTIYDLQYKTHPEFFSVEDVVHRDLSLTAACRKANALVAISEYSRQSAILHKGVKPEIIKKIYIQMAQRIKNTEDKDEIILNYLNLNSQGYLIYPANFWKHKNHEMLLTAFNIACNNGLGKDIKLVLTGAGARKAWLEEAVESMNLNGRILFPGYLTDKELAVLMSHSTAVIFPSLYEGFGLPVIEAMAGGIPVACSNLTSLPEVAGDAALFFDPRVPQDIAQAMIALTEDNELRERLIIAGKKQANKFSDTNRMAIEYWDLFNQAVSEKKQKNLKRVATSL